MKPGPKRLRTEIKLLRGSRQRPGLPLAFEGHVTLIMPTWLTKRGEAIWDDEIAPRQWHARAQSLAAQYCGTKARLEAAWEMLAHEGDILVTNTGYHQVNPAAKLTRDLWNDLLKLEEILNLSTSSQVPRSPTVRTPTKNTSKARFFDATQQR